MNYTNKTQLDKRVYLILEHYELFWLTSGAILAKFCEIAPLVLVKI